MTSASTKPSFVTSSNTQISHVEGIPSHRAQARLESRGRDQRVASRQHSRSRDVLLCLLGQQPQHGMRLDGFPAPLVTTFASLPIQTLSSRNLVLKHPSQSCSRHPTSSQH
jgi:hypothetical protein